MMRRLPQFPPPNHVSANTNSVITNTDNIIGIETPTDLELADFVELKVTPFAFAAT
jgi:hypothetical protein